jgi:hypothetical protein
VTYWLPQHTCAPRACLQSGARNRQQRNVLRLACGIYDSTRLRAGNRDATGGEEGGNGPTNGALSTSKTPRLDQETVERIITPPGLQVFWTWRWSWPRGWEELYLLASRKSSTVCQYDFCTGKLLNIILSSLKIFFVLSVVVANRTRMFLAPAS